MNSVSSPNVCLIYKSCSECLQSGFSVTKKNKYLEQNRLKGMFWKVFSVREHLMRL